MLGRDKIPSYLTSLGLIYCCLYTFMAVCSEEFILLVLSGADGLDQTREATCKESFDYGEKKRFSDDIMPHILRL